MVTAFLGVSTGAAGGLLLLGIMATVLPPLVLIPIHTVVQLGAIDADGIGALSTTQIRGFTGIQVASLSSDQVNALSTDQIEAFTGAQIAALTVVRMNQLIAELDEALIGAEADAQVRVIIIKGVGRAFSTGVKMRSRKRSPNRAMVCSIRRISIRSEPSPIIMRQRPGGRGPSRRASGAPPFPSR